MSLFGSSPDDSSLAKPNGNRQQSKDLFADAKPESKGGSSLFADEEDASSSPWSMPTPKKAARGDLLKTLVPQSATPESYVDAYDALITNGYDVNGKVDPAGISKLLETSSISAAIQSDISKLVAPDGLSKEGLERAPFNVLLALIGLAQEGEDATLDGVDERKKSMQYIWPQVSLLTLTELPQPSLPFLSNLKSSSTTVEVGNQAAATVSTNGAAQSSPQKSKPLHRNSFNDPSLDPWASPAIVRTTTQPVHNEASPANNEITAARPLVANTSSRTTSNFTNSLTDSEIGSNTPNAAPNVSIANAQGGWESIGSTTGFAASTDVLAGGFGSGADDPNPSVQPSRTINTRAVNRNEELVTVTLLPEKEGVFMFQHRNYEVKSARRGSSVVRRYSDFVWLLDCLHKRYPFRQLPLLPPKRIAGKYEQH